MTIKEIARIAGVSTSTVSKIVNGKDENMNIETRNRVLNIVKEYNYTPYASAIRSSNTKTFILGLLLNSTSESSLFIHGLLETAQKNGYSILLYNSLNSFELERKHITALCKNNIDGLIWEPISEASLHNKHSFAKKEIPINFINCPFVENSYNIDFIQIGYNATQSLIKYNHTKIACFIKENNLQSEMVLEGFKKCLFENNISYTNDMLFSHSQLDYCQNILLHNFTGIVSSHYVTALNLCDNLEKLNYKTPYDLSIVSLRDDILDNISLPRLSFIKIPHYEFGHFVVENLITKCKKEDSGEQLFNAVYTLENTLSLDIPISSRAQKIIVVGSVNIDITLNVDTLPQPGRTISSNSSSISLGGKGANQAIGVAKLNHPVALIGKVGNDYESTLIFHSISEYDVDVRGLTRDITTETGKAYIHVQSDGESTISILAGANKNLSPHDIQNQNKIFKNASYCLLQTEIPMDTIMETLKIAKAHNVQTILKPAALKYVSNELMKNINIFVPNEKEAELLCPHIKNIEQKSDYFLEKGVEIVIITRGHHGCYVKTKDFSKKFPAIPFTAVDTTGAADGFISALAVYLSCGYSLEKSVNIATYAASFCVNRQGVISALIDRNSLESYIKRHEKNLL
jgi:ribokinase